MGEQAVQDWKEHNVAAYSAPAATEMYARNARERGLTRSERRVLNAFFTPSAGTVLDVGCGAGRTTSRIAERGFDVVGMDVSEEMVRTAADLYPRLDFQVGDAANCPFGDDRFEYVLFSACGLDYPFPEAERRSALLEFRRVLKPGGVLAFNTHNSWYALPALLLDRSYLKDVYLAASNLSRLHAPYKVFPQEFDVATYVSNPRRQRRELREAGFEFLSCVGKRPTLKYLERCPYFISRKPIGREGRGGTGRSVRPASGPAQPCERRRRTVNSGSPSRRSPSTTVARISSTLWSRRRTTVRPDTYGDDRFISRSRVLGSVLRDDPFATPSVS